jgi:hypothetical protein
VRERGLRALLAWDTEDADLDLHLVGPGSVLGDPLGVLSARSRAPRSGGRVDDATRGPGPEVLSLDALGEGVHGLVVEPLLDGAPGGANATVRVLLDGALARPAAEGPVHVSAERGDLWIVGVIERRGGVASFTPIGEVVSAARPPTTAPEAWPSFY